MRTSLPRNRVLLCGYYGEHNLGDDALLEVLLSQLPAGCQATVTAHDAALVRERFGVETAPRRSLLLVLKALRGCDALVLGGGSLLQDSTSFGSLLYYSALLVGRLLRLVTALSWRDPESAALAKRLGRDGPVGSDPVWALPAQQWHGYGGPLVLCFRPTRQLLGPAWKPYLEALDQLAASHDREVIWLPFHANQDRGLLEQLRRDQLLPAGLAARSRELLAERPEEAMAVCSGASLVLAMRLHGLILSALSGAPCAALSYDPKVAAAAADLGCPCHSLDASPSPGMLASWDEALDTPPPASRLLELRQQTEVHRHVLALLDANDPGC